jgi:hypothetical protein
MTVTAFQSSGSTVSASLPCSDGTNPVILTPSPVGTNYNWSTGATTSTITVDVPSSTVNNYNVSYLVNGVTVKGCYDLSSCYFARIAPKASDETPQPETSEVELPSVDVLTAYPSPANQELTVALPYKVKYETPVTIYNIMGLASASGVMKEGEWKIKFNTAGFHEGLYIIKVGATDFSQVTKVMVLH